MDIRKFAVDTTARLHLRDAAGQLMYADADKSRPIAIELYGPGSAQFARAQAEQGNRLLEKFKNKSKTVQTAEQKAEENAEFLADCMAGTENLEYADLSGRDMLIALYTDTTLGFIAEQVYKFIADWGNFTRPSTQG
jgi:hypothetical protein